MLLKIAKSATLRTPVDNVWAVLREPPRVAACLPSVEDFRAGTEPGRFTTTLVERLGPFSVRVALALDVSKEAGGRTIVARLAGEDRGGQARVRGEVRAVVRPEGDGSVLDVSSDVEVLGRLASLGAVPIRRRGDQVFDQFVRNLVSMLEEGRG